MVDNLQRLWSDSRPAARAGLLLGTLAIVAMLVWALQGVLRTDYQVLFADLDPQDAATITAELDRMKLPYRLGADETSILVDRSQVHSTRLKLMGKGVNLRGGVGFEIFSNNDFGMTDFAQKINYQRALQGELTRTISALEEVRQVRVHLVMPESGLFRKSGAKPKAAITLAMKRGRKVSPQQVLGIQRLVAAAVPEIEASAVTIVDEQGLALTRAADPDGVDGVGSAGGGDARMSAKSEMEQHITRKAVAVLDKAFGPGRAIVTVDVTLDHNQTRVTREDVIPGNGRTSESAMTRKRTTLASGSSPPSGVISPGGDTSRGGGSTSEVEFQNGRRVEQVVSRPGSVRQISVAVLLPQALSPERAAEIRRVIAASVGLNTARGDELAISSLDQFANSAGTAATSTTTPASNDPSDASTAAARRNMVDPQRGQAEQPGVSAEPRGVDATPLQSAWWLALAALLLGLAVATVWYRRSREPRMSPQARERLLAKVRQWLADGHLVTPERKA